ncbi:hypothetical protein D9757_000761 [Collybiopsis confluens]|uniref:Ribonuclease H2 subunit B n=1 Tax=Collybiopsis confluens TaxID=2823264 RepID=A0A8H5I1E1_9AGAR|nr:hypothetical protein D9757_000761 [Collybiopsis confluens]
MAVHVGILPDGVVRSLLEAEDRPLIIRLPHPRTGLPTLFLPHQGGIAEVQAVEPVNSRSWFVGNQVVSDGKLLMITPVDPAFLLVPIVRSILPTDGTPGHFRTSDDIFEEAVGRLSEVSWEAIEARDVMKFASLECATHALSRVCDVQDIPPDITTYRYSATNFIHYLQLKVRNLLDTGIIDDSRMMVRSLAKDGLMEDGHERLLEAGRLKIACDLVGQYLPPDILGMLTASYSCLPELDAYLDRIEEDRRQRAQQLTTTATKRGKAAVKETPTNKLGKRKGSQGLEKLKKVNTDGMAKLSTFFTKKT